MSVRTLSLFSTLGLAMLVGCVAPATEMPGSLDGGDPVALPDSETPWCDAYVACLSETDPITLAAVLDAYGPDGSCWGLGSDGLCEQSCEQGLADVRDYDSELPLTCLSGATAEEILDVADKVCPDVFVPSDPEPLQAECIADELVACTEDAQSQVEDCMVEPPEPFYRAGIWRFDVVAVTQEACGPWPAVGRLRLSGDGIEPPTATRLDTGESTSCFAGGLQCQFFEGDPNDAMWVMGDMDDSLERFDGIWLVGDIESMWAGVTGACVQEAELVGVWESP